MKVRSRILIAALFLLVLSRAGFAQTNPPLPDSLTLEQCIDFALKNQPLVQQASLDEEINERDIKANLAGWYPQVNATGNFNHYLKLGVIVLPNFTDPTQPSQVIRAGLNNTSNALFQLDQTLFSNDLLLAAKGAKFVRLGAKQNSINTKINTTVVVSKAYYDILTNLQQLNILQENIARLDKQLRDAKAQYDAGLVDKTDYKRATIALSNSRADLRRTQEALKGKYATLKEVMGYPAEANIKLTYDSARMEQEMVMDTTQSLAFDKRIEVQQLETQRQLQKLQINYYKYGFLPTLTGFINYNFVYQNNELKKLYNQSYPTSVTGLTLRMPIFQGTRRIQNLRREELVDKRLETQMTGLKNQINSQYEGAMASYKGSLNDWYTAKENVNLSEDVYNTIKLQYNEGIKTYLDLMTAETDLRTAQIYYLNALYGVLASKLDVQQALGNITVK